MGDLRGGSGAAPGAVREADAPCGVEPRAPGERVVETLRSVVGLLAEVGPGDLVYVDGPGPELDAVLAHELVDLATRAVAAATALRQGALVAVEQACAGDVRDRCGCEACARGLPGCLEAAEHAAVELAVRLKQPARTVLGQLETAHTLVSGHPMTFRSALAGNLGPHQVDAVLDAMAHLTTEERRRGDEILHVTSDPAECTRAQLRRRASRIAAGIRAPQAAEEVARRQCLRAGPARDVPGLSEWFALLPTGRALEAERVIDAHARELSRATGESIEKCRPTALLDLVLGQAVVERVVEIAVPLDANLLHAARAGMRARGGDAEGGATALEPTVCMACGNEWEPPLVAPAIGVETPQGVLLAEQLSQILADPAVRVRLVGLDPATGVSTVVDDKTYRPGAALIRNVRARDGSCRFPQCSMPARQCEIDHVVPFPQGPTSADNLMALCKRHHSFKHHSRWAVTLDDDGVAIWIAPDGREHVTHPRDVRRLTR